MSHVYDWRKAPASTFAVIGNPIVHSLSPKMHAAIYRHLDLPWTYEAVQVPRGEVGAALHRLRDLGIKGVNVTVPHKGEVLEWCSEVEPFAAQVEAANTLDLERRSCINTDAPGFFDTLEPLPLKGKSVLILGAGGSARALTAAFAERGWGIRIYNRTVSKARELAERVGGEMVTVPDPSGADLIVNMTSSAFDSAALPVEWLKAEPHAIAYDLMYARESTPFLREAQQFGLKTVDGLALLVAQGARSFEWWTGLSAPRETMMEAIRSS